MQFNSIISATFFLVVGVGLLAYAARATKHAKTLFLALVASIVVGYLVGLSITVAVIILMNRDGEWSGSALYAIGLISGLAAAILSFIPVFLLFVKWLKTSIAPSQLRKGSLILGAASTLLAASNLYFIVPRLHPTPYLITQATGHDVDAFGPAQEELVRRGERVIPAILEVAAESPNIKNAFVLPSIIGQIPGPKSTESLFIMLENPNPEIRAVASAELGRRKEPAALEPLLKQLSSPELDYSKKRMVIEAISQLGRPSAMPDILKTVSSIDMESSGGYDKVLYEDSVIVAMGKLKHPQAYEFLVGLHQHPRPRIRHAVIQQLANYPSRQTASILIDHLVDSDISIRREADKILSDIAGIRWIAYGDRFTAESSENIHSSWEIWFEANADQLPENPVIGE